MTIIIVIALIILSGYFYCIGGRDKDNPEIQDYWFLRILPKWAFKGAVRDVGCTLCSVAVYLLIFPIIWWKLAVIIVLQFIACRSYFGFINHALAKLICHECGYASLTMNRCYNCDVQNTLAEKQWYNWLAIGLVSKAKWIIVGSGYPFVLLAVALMVMHFSNLEDNAVKEEFLRGIFII